MKSNKKRFNREFESLGTVLNGVMRKWRHGSDMALLQVWDVWETCLGPQIATNAQPAAFKGKRLIVHVASAVWVHELLYLKTDIIEKINRACEDHRKGPAKDRRSPLITDISFKIGMLEPR